MYSVVVTNGADVGCVDGDSDAGLDGMPVGVGDGSRVGDLVGEVVEGLRVGGSVGDGGGSRVGP